MTPYRQSMPRPSVAGLDEHEVAIVQASSGRAIFVGVAESSATVDVRDFTTTVDGSPITDTFARRAGEKAGVQRDFEMQIRRAVAADLNDVR